MVGFCWAPSRGYLCGASPSRADKKPPAMLVDDYWQFSLIYKKTSQLRGLYLFKLLRGVQYLNYFYFGEGDKKQVISYQLTNHIIVSSCEVVIVKM